MNRFDLLLAPAAAAIAAASLINIAAPAQAGSEVTVTGKPPQLCTDPPKDWYIVAPLSTNSLMLTTQSVDDSVACAYTAGSGRRSIKPGQTSNWSSSSPQGVNAEYKCYGDDGKNITYANSYVGSSGTGYTYNVQPTNWNTKTKHWGGAVLWSVADHLKTSIQASQYTRTCNGDDGVIHIARLYPVFMSMTGFNEGTIGVPSTYSLSVTANYGGGSPVAGQAALMVSRDDTYATPADDSALAGGMLINGSLTVQTAFVTGTQANPIPLTPGTYYLFGAYAGTQSTTPVIPSSGWFKMATKTMPITVSARPAPTGTSAAAAPIKVTSPQLRSATVPRPFTGPMGASIVQADSQRGGRLSIVCPTGGVPTQININSSDPDVGADAITIHREAGRIRMGVVAPDGASTQIQAICRKAAAPLAGDANLTYGSAGDDDVSLGRKKSSVYAGLGRDVIVLKGAGSVGDGGLGADDITVAARDAVGVGGFGKDALRSTTSARSLIVGGPGRDILIGGTGHTIINAQDGRPGDVITCRSARNEVYKDKGDVLHGPCVVR